MTVPRATSKFFCEHFTTPMSIGDTDDSTQHLKPLLSNCTFLESFGIFKHNKGSQRDDDSSF